VSNVKYRLLATLGLFCCSTPCGAAEPRFHPPVRLKAGGVAIRVEAPGYAAPCLADVDGDGKRDLLVGQFNLGKIRVFKGLGGGKFARGAWLQVAGKVAEVPGIW
jgi:hypothetical protein